MPLKVPPEGVRGVTGFGGIPQVRGLETAVGDLGAGASSLIHAVLWSFLRSVGMRMASGDGAIADFDAITTGTAIALKPGRRGN